MDANDRNNIDGRENEAHEIPADPSGSDNNDDSSHQKRRSRNANDIPNESADNRNRGEGIGELQVGGTNNGDGDFCHVAEANDGYHDDGPRGASPMVNYSNVYPNGAGPQQFFPPSDPQHSHFDPSSGGCQSPVIPNHLHPFPYNSPHHQPLAHHMNTLPPNLPPMLPPPPSMSMPNHNGPGTLDATRQYYEARMREHAMQYANAAAGAAWAAARIACGGENHAMPPPGFMGNNSMPSYYAPASAAPPSSTGGQQMIACQNLAAVHSNQMVMPSVNQMVMPSVPGSVGGPRHKRTLWHPPSFPENKTKEGGSSKVPKKVVSNSNDTPILSGPKAKAQKVASSKPTSPQLQDKKPSKKRESGNDSVSSLGSESRDLNISGHSKGGGREFGGVGRVKRTSKKSNQRRRFNEDAGNAARSSSKTNDHHRGKNHFCQKRGGSFSSHGSSNNPHHSAGGRNKKKNRSQPEALAPPAAAQKKDQGTSNIFLGGLVGKNGVRALHELCGKYRWEMPKYTSSDSTNDNDGDAGHNNDISFVLIVHVNGVELGRGRGGTKGAAKQDASRKALAGLIPGVIFDPNGILLDLGSSNELLLRGSNYEGGTAARSRHNGGSKSLSLDELGPHLASQLAIGGENNATLQSESGGAVGLRSRTHSPDHSADSSISTLPYEEVSSGAGPLISGGPLLLKVGLQQLSPNGTLASGGARFISSNIYPCASTTSGVSSASEDIDEEDENAYYSSRGASVCSTLLHAIWQIDDRIREPPSYKFDLCPGTMKNEGQLKSDTVATSTTSGNCCSKRKKVESPRDVTAAACHRMFQCAASLNLYFPKSLVGGKGLLSPMDYWESPLDYLQSKEYSSLACDKGESSQSRKRKDSFASQSTQSPSRQQQQLNDDIVEQQEEPSSSPNALTKEKKREECIQHKVESTGIGSTKRESKHKASAKLLAALFPNCSSIVEVKAEAEAARELYAANKAALSQTKRAKVVKVPSPQSKGPSKRCSKSDISLHALTLSEQTKEGMMKRIKWSDSTNNAETSFESQVDAALQSLQELDEEGLPWAARDLSFDDVGKIILRRAMCDDADHVHALLNRNGMASTMLAKRNQFSTTDESVGDAEIDGPVPSENIFIDNAGKELQQHQLGNNATILVLSRAVALQDPPLGCAILTLNTSSSDSEVGRNLALCRLGHEKHLPRERFIECLETFARNVQCTLNDTCDLGASSLLLATSDDIKTYLSQSPSPYRSEDVSVDRGGIKGNSSSQHRHLQSVKEEGSEEVDGSEGEEESDKKGDATRDASELAKGRPCGKPSKRSRVA